MKIESIAITTVDELVPILNHNMEETVTGLMKLGKRCSKLERRMNAGNLIDFAICLCLFGVISVTGGMLKQMDIQRQRIDILEGLVKDTQNTVYNTVINTKDKDEEM